MTDDVTHLRALLAEQTARADHEHAEMQKQAELAVDWMIDAQRAIAANAEMRAALERSNNAHQAALYDEDLDRDDERDAQRVIDDTHALLSRPDLGAGMVVVPREVVERLREAAMGEIMISPKALADLDALLKKGGG